MSVEADRLGAISVIIPCYNGAAFVADAIRSVLAQQLVAREIIVVDDGSTDGSAAEVEEFGKAVRLLRGPHRGIAAARNHGLAAAEGELIAWLDADDLWEPQALRVLAEALAADRSLAGVYGMVEQFSTDDVAERRQVPSDRTAARRAGTMLLRRSACALVGGFDEELTLGEMIDWISRAEGVGLRLAPVERLVLRRRIHDGNTTILRRSAQTDYLRLLHSGLRRKARRGEAVNAPA
jgi:glycosyltransferase involved in cell wall biosynthesis